MTCLLPDTNNPDNDWQGSMRCGNLDIPALRYAIRVNGGVDYLAVTHVDKLNSKFPACINYQGENLHVCSNLEANTRMTERLRTTKPILSTAEFTSTDQIETWLGYPVGIKSWGPGPREKGFVNNLARSLL